MFLPHRIKLALSLSFIYYSWELIQIPIRMLCFLSMCVNQSIPHKKEIGLCHVMLSFRKRLLIGLGPTAWRRGKAFTQDADGKIMADIMRNLNISWFCASMPTCYRLRTESQKNIWEKAHSWVGESVTEMIFFLNLPTPSRERPSMLQINSERGVKALLQKICNSGSQGAIVGEPGKVHFRKR